MHKIAGKISRFIMAGLICLGQTRVVPAQLQGAGTSPRLVWSRGFYGQRVRMEQARAPRAAVVTLTPAGRSFSIVGEAPCSGYVREGQTALMYVGYVRGRVVVLAGYRTSTGYVPTRDVIGGDCQYADFTDGRYPKGLNGLIYLGVYGMPTSAAWDLKGVAINEAPTSYSMDGRGLTGVRLIGGREVKP